MKKTLTCLALLAVVTLPACTNNIRTLDQNVLRAHAERNCHVAAATTESYDVNRRGDISINSSAYSVCMQHAGFSTGT